MDVGARTVLLIEDEKQMRCFLKVLLPSHGYSLIEAETGREGIVSAGSNNPDIILLDLGLPDADGIELTMQLREFTQRPIIILSARKQADDKVAAFGAGADDYLTKPFAVSELLARMRVAQRHTEGRTHKDEHVFTFDSLVINVGKRLVTLDGREVRLTPIEWKLIVVFSRNSGRVITHQQLLQEVWGTRYGTQTRYLHVYVGQLRSKLEREPSQPRLLLTEPGVGYRLKAE
jgi:two-component system KDP operon response regulator KdpE